MRWVMRILVWLGLATFTVMAAEEEEAYPVYPPYLPYGASRYEESDPGYEISLALAAIGPAAEPALVEMLASTNQEERRYAAVGLGWMGAVAAPYVDRMVDQLMAFPVADYLLEAAIGRVGQTAVPRLVQELKSDDERAQRACLALWETGPKAQGAIPALVEALEQASPELRSLAALTLGRVGPSAEEAIPALISALDDPSEDVRSSAAYALGELKLKPEMVIPALSAALEKEDSSNAFLIASALSEYGPAASSAIPSLRRAFLEYGQLSAMAVSLAALGTQAIPVFVEALKSEDPLIRYYGGYGLGAVAVDASGAVDALIAALNDPETDVRWCAAQSLGFIGAQPEHVVPVLIELMRDPDPTVRYCTVYALGYFGGAAVDAVDVLCQALHDEDEQVQHGAVVSLGQIGPQASVAADDLHRLISETDWLQHGYIAAALLKIGVPAAEVVQDLPAPMELDAAWEVGSALYDIGPEALPALLELLQHTSGQERIVAAATLGMLGSQAAAANADLQAALEQDSDELTQIAIALAFVQTGGDPALALPMIRAALVSPDTDARLYGAFAAEQLGPDAATVVPDLCVLLADADWELQLSVVNALRAIGPQAEAAVDPLIAQLKQVAQQAQEFSAEG